MEYHQPPECLPSMKIDNFRENPEEREWKEPFTFIVGADTQFGMSTLIRFLNKHNIYFSTKVVFPFAVDTN